MRCFNQNNALVIHRLDTGHTADWKNCKVLKYENDTVKRRCLESAFIATSNNVNQNNGFITLAKPLAYVLAKCNPG